MRSIPAFPVAAGAVAVWALFLNLFRLSTTPPSIDEPLYAQMGWNYLHWWSLPPDLRRPALSNFEHPPLAKVVFGLAELVTGHESLTAARATAVTTFLAAAVLLAVWLARVADRWTALLTFGLLALVPMSTGVQDTRFARDAMLDNVTVLFSVGALLLAWRWFRVGGRRAWKLAVATGFVVGLATATKENGFLTVVGLVILGVRLTVHDRRSAAQRLSQTAAAVVVAAVTFFVTYLPFGDPFGRLHYLLHDQFGHSRVGHSVGFAGRVTMHPPWWANFWFAGHDLGPVLAWVLLAFAVAGLALRRGLVTGWCAAALLGPVLFHCVIAGVALEFYWVLWSPAFFALAAIGITEVVRRAAALPGTPVRALAGAAVLLAAVVVVSSVVRQTWTVATLEPVGAVTVPPLRDELGLHGSILTTGLYLQEIRPALQPARIWTRVPGRLTSVDTVLVGKRRCRTPLDPAVRALVRVNLEEGTLRRVRSDRLLTMYVVQGPLVQPSYEDVVAEPVSRPTDGC